MNVINFLCSRWADKSNVDKLSRSNFILSDGVECAINDKNGAREYTELKFDHEKNRYKILFHASNTSRKALSVKHRLKTSMS